MNRLYACFYSLSLLLYTLHFSRCTRQWIRGRLDEIYAKFAQPLIHRFNERLSLSILSIRQLESFCTCATHLRGGERQAGCLHNFWRNGTSCCHQGSEALLHLWIVNSEIYFSVFYFRFSWFLHILAFSCSVPDAAFRCDLWSCFRACLVLFLYFGGKIWAELLTETWFFTACRWSALHLPRNFALASANFGYWIETRIVSFQSSALWVVGETECPPLDRSDAILHISVEQTDAVEGKVFLAWRQFPLQWWT